jgi:NTP pyrophosphatase (non-canonical NTP hydrolase)
VDKETELLVITMEECGELTQACSKVLRRGADEKRSRQLMEEAGDVMCMIKLLVEKGYFSWQDLENRVQYKLDKLESYKEVV